MSAATIFLLKNAIQPYSWGHKQALERLFCIDNPEHKPQAEIWMGAHPKAPSQLRLSGGKTHALDKFIAEGVEAALGEQAVHDFEGNLPFLLKVLSAAQPLSIQAHPNKQQAVEGFARENDQNIAVDVPHRNYRDDNHKPELIYALTPFKAMNGFRPFEEIIRLFSLVENETLAQWLPKLKRTPNSESLKSFYQQLMALSGEQQQKLLADVLMVANHSDEPALQEVVNLHNFYPGDTGVLSPLLLNLVSLVPGQAMFLKSGTLHAYLEGTGLEIMANSDNVLRGGLTCKHVDLSELLKTIVFEPADPSTLFVDAVDCGVGASEFPVPVNDFSFSVIHTAAAADGMLYECQCRCGEILFCICGSFTVQSLSGQKLTISAGQSCFVMASTESYTLTGRGRVARASA
jgi:mannose-6-phosphate isomerase